MHTLCYLDIPVSSEITASALVAAAQCGYDAAEEVLLHCRVLGVSWVAAHSARERYPSQLEEMNSKAPEEIVRVDWQVWAISKQFDGGYEQSVVERVESIVVDVPTLLSGEVYTYGLGPEHNWLEWAEGSITGEALPDEVFEALCDVIVEHWPIRIREMAEGNPDYLEGIHARLRGSVSRVLGSCGDGT
jgi:hypothetical protein